MLSPPLEYHRRRYRQERRGGARRQPSPRHIPAGVPLSVQNNIFRIFFRTGSGITPASLHRPQQPRAEPERRLRVLPTMRSRGAALIVLGCLRPARTGGRRPTRRVLYRGIVASSRPAAYPEGFRVPVRPIFTSWSDILGCPFPVCSPGRSGAPLWPPRRLSRMGLLSL